MTALAAARNTVQMGSGVMVECLSVPVAASTKIYQGALVGLDSAGRAVAGTSNATARSILGRARALADNSSGAAAAISVEVERGCFKFANSATTDALTSVDVGQPCYVVDDQTVARTPGTGTAPRMVAGMVMGVDTDGVWVQLIGGSMGQFIDIPLGPASADYSASGNVIVTFNSSGKVVLCGAGGLPVGVLMNAPVADAIAIVRVAGLAPVKADGTGYALGDKISCAANGLGRATAAAASGNAVVDTSDAGAAADPLKGGNILGRAIVAAAASATGLVLLTHSGAVPTTEV